MLPEIWKPVVGYEGIYEVSDHGRVRSVDRVITYRRVDQFGNHLTVARRYPGRELKPASQESGHLHVQLGRKRTARVHVLVLEAFVGPCPEGMEGCHGDGRPRNNAASNLRWDTHQSNLSDTIRHGTRLVGAKNHMTKLTREAAADIKRSKGLLSQVKLAALHGVSKSAVQAIHDKRTWADV